MAISKEVIAEITAHIRVAEGKRGVCFLIGAGASIRAGIPLAAELVSEVRKNYSHCVKDLPKEHQYDYGRVMSCLSQAERVDVLGPYLTGASINWGQIALAALIERGFMSRVLTFNFDLVLEKATALLGQQIPVYDFGAAPDANISRIASPSIIHLHGQSYGFTLLNSDDETRRHQEQLRPLLRDTVQDYVTIVIGYSGEADPALETICQEFDGRQRMLWLGHDKEPKPHLQELLKKPVINYYGGCDFDELLIGLALALDLWPPQVITNPMRHILSELEPVADYPREKGAKDPILEPTKKRLAEFGDIWAADGTDIKALLELATGKDTSAATLDRLSDKSVAMSEAAKTSLAWVYLGKADALEEEAKSLTGNAAEAKFSQVYQEYTRATAIKPDMSEAFYNWGTTLQAEAGTLDGAAARGKLQEGYAKYARAVEIKPDDHEVFYNWGSALQAEAGTLDGAAARGKLQEAYAKYARAVEIEPDMHEAFYNWGGALQAEAGTLDGAAARGKLQEAYAKYARAVEIEPDMHEAFNNWGIALQAEAGTLDGAAARGKLQEAYANYARAAEIKPDDHEVFNNWGIALQAEAGTLDGAAARGKLQEAYAKYARAVEIEPDVHAAFSNWSTALCEESYLAEGEERLALLREAKTKAEAAKAISGKDTYNLACTHALLGDESAALAELAACRDDGTLPDREYLDSDRDLDGLRDTEGYKAFRATLE